MAYILSAQLDTDIPGYAAFENYRAYLDDVGHSLPAAARALATSEWYFNTADHRAPHDAWLDSVRISEAEREGRAREVTIALRLLGAYQDGHIQLVYRDVRSYRLELTAPATDSPSPLGRSHRDWRYDEFRASADGRVEHEIEWWAMAPTGSWLIDAADIEYEWLPLSNSDSPLRVI